MKFIQLFLGVVGVTFCSAASPADETSRGTTSGYQAILSSALTALDLDYKDDWAYTESTRSSDESVVGRYDPRTEPRWQLQSIDNLAPTADQLEKFQAEKSADVEVDIGDDEGEAGRDKQRRDIGNMVMPGSLSLVEETEDHWIFSFVPQDDDEEEFMQHMEGTLKVVKDGPYLAWINIEAKKPFKPRFGVKVKRFLTRLQFAPANPDGPVVPLSIDIEFEIKAFVVKTINERVSIRYDDYEFAAADD